MLFYLIDIILIAFIIGVIFINYKKGLIGVAFKIVSFFIAIIISVILFKPVSYFIINATPIDDKVNSYVYNVVDDYLTSKEKNDTTSNFGLPASINKYIEKTVNDTKNTIKENVTQAVSENITSTIINILAFLVVFIITRIILIFVQFLSDILSELPIVKQFNEIGGIIYGLLKAFLIIFIILALISILPLPTLQSAINKTLLTLFLYNVNPILWILL